MALTSGSRLGPYEIVGPLGAGGMGEVYRARDTRLNRDVALKILPDLFVTDPERVARFEREAQALAALNHPHIAQIHGLEESGSTRALVMELVEGEDLSQRLARGAIALAEALAIARQIADALEAAHGQGIIHRDLKPANIKVREDGTVKVLDFGLAKAIESAGDARGAARAGRAADHLLNSPTITSPAMTLRGMILGTAAYMAPEQARGKPVDKRADLWAFGCVLYEMLTARQAFGGETVTDTLAAIVNKDPDWSALPPDTPPPLRRVLRRCLQKDPARRARDAGDLILEIDEAIGSAVEAGVEPVGRPGRRRVVEYSLMAALVIASVAVGVLARAYISQPLSARPLVRFHVDVPPGPAVPAVSPDGRHLAVTAIDPTTLLRVVWVYALDGSPARTIPGTENVSGNGPVFWSPDSRTIAFHSAAGLKTVDITAGAPRLVCPSFGLGYRGGTWSRDGTILVSTADRGLFRVAASGGTPTPVFVPDATRGERSLLFPHFLPDGQRFLFTRVTSERDVCVGSLDRAERRCLGVGGDSGTFDADGYLLFTRGGALMAQAFDATLTRPAGEAFTVADEGAFSVSETGILVYRARGIRVFEELVWFDRRGARLARVGETGSLNVFDLSADGRYIAVLDRRPTGATIWTVDALRGTSTKAVDEGKAPTAGPVWSPDGRHIAYVAIRLQNEIVIQPAFGGNERTVFRYPSGSLFLEDWSHDGRSLALVIVEGGRRKGVVIPVDEAGSPAVFAEGNAMIDEFQFAPDGKAITYNSDESGRSQVYISPLPPTGERWQISTAGGVQGQFANGGKELLYLAPDGTLMATTISLGQRVEAGVPKPMFKLPLVPSPREDQYRMSPDGQRFLFRLPVQPGDKPQMTVVVNWTELARR